MALTTEEKFTLLKIARAALTARVADGTSLIPGSIDIDSKTLNEQSGAFVTLNKGEHLRGCIGVFSSFKPLFQTVAEMAISAAVNDPRFRAVLPEELPFIDIEISVLTPLTEIKDPKTVEVGRHGLCVAMGNRRGVLLPQVATEHGFDRETFLGQTCIKAGLPAGAWRSGATIYVFEAEIIKERNND